MQNSCFKAGAGRAVIHFPSEYFPSENYYGVHDDMHARVILMERGDERGAIVTLELPSVRPWELTDELRAFAAELLEAKTEKVWLCMTHDLSAPHVPTDEAKRAMHMNAVRNAIREASEQALSSLREAVIGYGEASSYVNANRDMESVDGWWVGIEGKGPSDKTLSLIRFDGVDGRPIAVLYSYAIKSSVLELAAMSDGRMYASGDVTGKACCAAEEKLGTVVMFLMGAAGDQVPRLKANYLALDENNRFYTVNLKEKGYEFLDQLGSELGDDVVSACRNTVCDDASPVLHIETFSMTASCKKPYPKSLPTPPVKSYIYEPAGPEEIEIYSMRIGNAALLGLKAEVTTPIFSKIKERSPMEHNLMATLVNGGQGYIATDVDYERFSYPGLNTHFVKGTDCEFADAAVNALNKLSQISG